MKLSRMKPFSTLNDEISLDKRDGEVVIILNENNKKLSQVFTDANLISTNLTGIYYIKRMHIAKDTYVADIEGIKTDNEKVFTVPTKTIETLNGKSGIIDLSFLLPLLSTASVMTQKSTVRAVVNELNKNLLAQEYTKVSIVYFPAEGSLKERSPFFDILRNPEFKNIELFLAGKGDELVLVKVKNNATFDEKKDIPKIISVFLRVQLLKPTKKNVDAEQKEATKDIDAVILKYPEELHNTIRKAFKDGILNFEDIAKSSKKEIIVNIAANALSDTNTKATLKKYDEKLYAKLLEKRLQDFDPTKEKKVILKKSELKRQGKTADFLPKADVVKDFREQYAANLLQEQIRNGLKNLENDDEYPLVLTDFSVSDSSTQTTLKQTVNAEFVDINGNKVPLNFDIPKIMADGKSFYVDGTRYILLNQLFSKPVVQLDADRVAVTTNYAKVMIYRMGEDTSANKITKVAQVFENVKPAENGSELIRFLDGESEKAIGAKSYFTVKEEVTKEVFHFFVRQGIADSDKTIRFDFSDKNYSFVGYKGKVGSRMFILLNKDMHICEVGENDINDLDTVQETDFTLINYIQNISSVKNVFRRSYTRINIIGQKLPLILVLMSKFSAKEIFEAAGIQYYLADYDTNIKETQVTRVLTFADGKVAVVLDSLDKELLINFLSQMSNTNKLLSYSVKEFFAKNNNQIVESIIKKNTMTAINNNFKYFIDSITEDILKQYLLPTNILELFVYANRLLSTNEMIEPNDFQAFRLRNFETIPAVVYKELTAELGKFRNTYARSRVKGRMKFSFPKERIMRALITGLPNVNPYSSSNIFVESEEANKVTYGGHLGINNDRSLTLGLRKTHPSRIGIVDNNALTDSANVGGVLAMTLDTNIADLRGTMNHIELADVDRVAKENPSRILGASLSLEPYGAVRSDSMRASTITIQQKHVFSSPSNFSKPLIRTGAEDVIMEKLGSDFVLRTGSEKLKVVSIDTEQRIVHCQNEKGFDINLSYARKILKNGGAGFFHYTDYVLVKGIKAGSVLAPNSKYAFSTSFFKDGILGAQGKLVKLALIPSLELIEDAVIISDKLANDIFMPFVYDKSVDLIETQHLSVYKKIGEKVNAEQTLIEYTEGLPKESKGGNDILDNLFGDDIGRAVRSPAKGYISNIELIYNKKDEDLTKQELEFIKYLNDLDEKEGIPNGITSRVKKDVQGKILGRRISNTINITYYISKEIKGKSGSKLTLQSTKGVYRVVPEREMPRLADGTYAEVMISTFSTITRMTMSAITSNVYSNTIIVELKKRIDKLLASNKVSEAKSVWGDFIKSVYKSDKKFMEAYLQDFAAKDEKALREFFDDLHMTIRAFSEPKLKDLVQYAQSHNIVVEQNFTIYDSDTKKYSKMLKPGICGYTMIKFLAQIASKKTSQSHKVNDTNANTGTLTANAKVAQFSAEEASAAFSYGIENELLPEFLSIRADNIEGRMSMDKQIIENGSVSLKDVNTTGEGGVTNLIAFTLLGAGYESSFRADITAREEGKTIDVR